MLNFPKNTSVVTSQIERQFQDDLDFVLYQLFQNNLSESMDDLEKLLSCPIQVLPTDVYPISQKNSEFSNMPYGRYGTVGESACGPLVAEYALRLMGFPVKFEDILHECEAKGYRGYVFDENNAIIGGAGTENILFSNIAKEIESFSQLLTALRNGSPVTLLIMNDILWSDTSRTGNHFITLIGIDNFQNAILMDGNLIKDTPTSALIRKPFKDIISGIKGAWSWDEQQIRGYLE